MLGPSHLVEVTRASTGARKAGRGCVGMYEPGMPALDNAVGKQVALDLKLCQIRRTKGLNLQLWVQPRNWTGWRAAELQMPAKLSVISGDLYFCNSAARGGKSPVKLNKKIWGNGEQKG